MSSSTNDSSRPSLRSPNEPAFGSPGAQHHGTAKSRTTHACNRCRLMRTKCSGGTPCGKCRKDDAECAYGDRKRERNKKDLAESLDRIDILEGENQFLVSALRSVAASPGFQSSEHSDIVDMLSKYSSQERSESGQGSSGRSRGKAESEIQSIRHLSQSQISESEGRNPSANDGSSERAHENTRSGERAARASAGSPGRQGELSQVVDLDSGKGATGFVGRMSEMAWIQRTWEHLLDPPNKAPNDVPRAVLDTQVTAARDFTYFMDDTDILSVDEDHVDEQQSPPLKTTLILSEAYFHALQGAFYFVRRESFLQSLLAFPHQRAVLDWSQRRWLALANLVWAIGSKWLQMSRLDHVDNLESHLVYYARARRLGLDHRLVSDHPNIERVQAMGILAFYLLINGSVARAWNALGQATRHATALGMHLRVTDPKIDEEDRHRRARAWYSLYSLEVLMAEITGRPKSISISDVTIPINSFLGSKPEKSSSLKRSESSVSLIDSRKIWLEFLNRGRDLPHAMQGGVIPWKSFASVGQSSSPAHFPHRIFLCRLSDKIASQLYNGTTEDSWQETQRKIGGLQTELRRWEENLPDELTIQGTNPVDTDPRVKIELSMYYHSIQMILNRPCLCEVVIEDESRRSQEFNRSCARVCVHAAMSMLAVMPDKPSAHEAYQLLPFWALLHYVAQATAVLLLELSLDSQHFPQETPEVVHYLRKAMSYLWCMTETSLSAYRAWRIFRRLLSATLERYEDLDMADIPEEAPQPAGWWDEDERNLQNAFV